MQNESKVPVMVGGAIILLVMAGLVSYHYYHENNPAKPVEVADPRPADPRPALHPVNTPPVAPRDLSVLTDKASVFQNQNCKVRLIGAGFMTQMQSNAAHTFIAMHSKTDSGLISLTFDFRPGQDLGGYLDEQRKILFKDPDHSTMDQESATSLNGLNGTLWEFHLVNKDGSKANGRIIFLAGRDFHFYQLMVLSKEGDWARDAAIADSCFSTFELLGK